LYGCDRAAPRRLRHRGGAARHRADRDATARALAALARAGVVLRRRYGRAARRASRAAPGIAAASARAQPALRDAAARRGPGFLDPDPRPTGFRRSADGGTAALGNAVAERAGGAPDRHARAARGPRTPTDADGRADRRSRRAG